MEDINVTLKNLATSTIDDAETLALAMSGTIRRRTRDDFGLDDDSDGYDLLDSMALEIYGSRRVGPHQTGDLDSVTVVTGTGGPHTEFTVTPSDRVTAHAYWASDSAEAHAYVDGLFDSLADLVTEM